MGGSGHLSSTHVRPSVEHIGKPLLCVMWKRPFRTAPKEAASARDKSTDDEPGTASMGIPFPRRPCKCSLCIH